MIENGPVRSHRREWGRDEIAVIRPGSVEVEGSTELTWGHELQIHLIDGEIVGLLAGHPWKELAWIATVLRGELNVPAVDERD